MAIMKIECIKLEDLKAVSFVKITGHALLGLQSHT